MANTTTSSFSALLLERHSDDSFKSALYKNNPGWGIIPKAENFTGDTWRLVVEYAPTTGNSRRFTTAQARQGPRKDAKFNVTRAHDYATFGIDTEAILASRGNSAALREVVDTTVKAATNAITRMMAINMFGSHGGSLGQVGSTATTTLELKESGDVTNFEVGMYLDSSATDGTSGSADGDSIQITKIDRQAGTLTAATNWTANSNFSDDDYIFREGDFGQAGHGFQSWVPSSNPSASESYFGQDRSFEPVRLAGLRYTATSTTDPTIETCLVNCAAELGLHGGRPDYCFMNPLDRRILIRELEVKTVHYKTVMAQTPKGPSTTIGYRAIAIEGPSGPIMVLGDPNVTRGTFWMPTMDTWLFRSLGPAPRYVTLDAKSVVQATNDGIEGRLGYYGNFMCKLPGGTARINGAAIPELAADLA